MKNSEEKNQNKNTFIVKLDHQQNGTWQGRVVWAEENRSQRFRSLLELIKLMDDAMAQGEVICFGEWGTSQETG